MTGFGEASRQVDDVHYAVELRSLNNRYFKTSLRLPEELTALEPELESQLRKRISRGSITLVVKYRATGDAAAHSVNDAVLLRYLDHLEAIHDKVAAKEHSINIDMTALLALPGVLEPSLDEERLFELARPVVLALTDEACDKLMTMREHEGRALAQDLGVQREAIAGRLETIAARTPQVVEEYHQRLRSRMDDLLARAELSVAQTDLIREVAIFSERSDISEEVTRLKGHLEQMDQIVHHTGGEPAGRTLDFLAQELLREANTIASKSNDTTISRAIVEVKGAIDRIKEQVQNVE